MNDTQQLAKEYFPLPNGAQKLEAKFGITDNSENYRDRIERLLLQSLARLEHHEKILERVTVQRQTIIDNLKASKHGHDSEFGNNQYTHYFRDQHSDMLIEMLRHYQKEIKNMQKTRFTDDGQLDPIPF